MGYLGLFGFDPVTGTPPLEEPRGPEYAMRFLAENCRGG
jgi:hypothetical protein